MPAGGAIEGQPGYTCDTSSDDCHLIVLDPTRNQFWESYQTTVHSGGNTHTTAIDLLHLSINQSTTPKKKKKKTVVQSTCAIVWNMTKAYPNSLRGNQCTSADAAGFPIAPLLFTPEEVVRDKLIDHAIR